MNRRSGRLLAVASGLAWVVLAVSAAGLVPSLCAQSSPPAFTFPINSLFPNQPFVTCIQGQFEPGQPGPTATLSPPHFWFLRPRGSDTLTIDVRAVSVNASEQGSITATLFAGTTQLGFVTVPHPPLAPPAENIGLITLPNPMPFAVYRLDVVRTVQPAPPPPPFPGAPPPQGIPEAHHYKLSFSGPPVDVGINSPSFRYLEPGPQNFHVNIGPGEGLSLSFPSDATPPGIGSLITLQVSRRDTGEVVLQQAGTPPFTVNVPKPFGGGSKSGTMVLTVNANGHYKMEKLSGADLGIYFDTCPPFFHPAGATARTMGFWKNHDYETAFALLAGPPVVLGSAPPPNPNAPTPDNVVDSLAKAKAIFDAANSNNAYDMLAAQLLATELNLRSGVPGPCIVQVVNDADASLAAAGYTGPPASTSPADKAAVLILKDKLDSFNNNGCP